MVARPAALATVWSNCLAGWWLGGAGRLGQLPFLFLGATLLYFGAVFLNDAFDAEFDHDAAPSRPVPSGALSQQSCWRSGVALLVGGTLLLLGCGFSSGALGLALVLMIVVFNAIHRLTRVGPVLHGISRCLLYMLGASMADHGVTGWSIWCGLAAGLYVTGVDYFSESRLPGKIRLWPLYLLGAPVGLGLIMDVGRYRETGLLLSGVLVLWSLRCLRQTFWSPEPDLRSSVNGLVAGIVFMDWLATCPANFAGYGNQAAQQISIAFLALFALTLALQKWLPQTGTPKALPAGT